MIFRLVGYSGQYFVILCENKREKVPMYIFISIWLCDGKVSHYGHLPLNIGAIFQTVIGPSLWNWPRQSSMKNTGNAPRTRTVKYGMMKAPEKNNTLIIKNDSPQVNWNPFELNKNTILV